MPLFLSEEELRLHTVCAEAEENCALLDQVSEKLASELAAGPELAADLAEVIQQYERQVSILKHEKEILVKSKRNQQEYIKRLERDCAELKREVQEQRDHVRVLTLDKKSVFDGCMKQVEDMRRELQNSWKASNDDAASRAAVAEEKELLEKHNLWLDEELKAKVKNLADLRKSNMDEESRMSAKIAEASFFN